ncbi:prostaglandin E synthase 2-like isoform X1 [Amphibalanus amphitrite]|uniref:prostaglandin E synthase 2-like isoform X1 n=1 Tax=Amphibalanus amphitrite TaxID=1232801 RepID=UPI001C8FB675|nr:prostaglandin E synthase 2-like isoform X1 [Amphibalanus amphitrite]
MARQGCVTGALWLGRNILNKELNVLKSGYSTKDILLRNSSARIEAVRCASTNSETQRKKPKLGVFGKAVLLGIGVGGAYGYYSYEQRKKLLAKPASGAQFLLKEPPPEHPPSKRVSIPGDNTGLKLTLYQYQTCPFCCKVRAFLDYYGISYDLIEVNPVLRKEVKWSSYKKVPVVVAETPQGWQQLNDSSMVMSALYSYLYDPSRELPELASYYPPLTATDADGRRRTDIMNKYFLMYGDRDTKRTKEDIKAERAWRRWADDVLVHTLSPNVYRTPSEALQAFRWFSETGDWERLFSNWERLLVIYVGAAAMYGIGKILKRRHNLKSDVRESLYEACDTWTRELRHRGTPFLGGERPNVADVSVYGVLSSIEGCDAFQELLQHTKIGPWFARMKEAVTKHEGGRAVV